jgi:hypothetical protein
MLQDFSCPAHVDVVGNMPVISMVDNIYMYIVDTKMKSETAEGKDGQSLQWPK